MTKPNDLHDYFKAVTVAYLENHYREHKPAINVDSHKHETIIKLNAAAENKKKSIQIVITIAYDVHLILCQPEEGYPLNVKLMGYRYEPLQLTSDDREGPRPRDMQDGARFFLPNLPFLPPPSRVQK